MQRQKPRTAAQELKTINAYGRKLRANPELYRQFLLDSGIYVVGKDGTLELHKNYGGTRSVSYRPRKVNPPLAANDQ